MTHHVIYLIYCKQHSEHPKKYKQQKLRNKTEGDTNDSIIQSSENNEINLISKKFYRKN